MSGGNRRFPTKRQSLALWLAYKGMRWHPGESAKAPARPLSDLLVAAFVESIVGGLDDQPCQLYMYETYMSGVRKFGISRDCMQRAKSKKKREAGWYGKYLWHIDLPSRRAAILIESAFATVSGECESTTVDYTWEGFDDLRRLLGGGSEFTRMSLDNFVATVTMLERQYAGIGRVGFAKKRVSDCIDYLQVAEVISSGIGFFASCDPGVLKSGIPRPLDVISEAPYGRQIDYYQTGPISADRKLDDWRGYVLDYSEVLSFYGIDPFVEPAWVSGEWWE